MEDPKQRIIDSLKQANNILVTVKNSPSIDALAACIALTLVLNELDKHGTAVFSGEIPSVLEFLEPGKTLERNTDSLQDFIISLDKSKADKLRYKVEDSVVKIFITPYKTSISEQDLEFGQGDFNVDVVVALGVHNQNDLDQAITTHGRILHDATVISMDTEAGGGEDLGSINWIDANASSLSEMVAGLANELGKEDAIDNQVATALLTGIVSETERFGNAKTSPDTMKVAAALLTAGANQELVATKLSEPAKQEVKEEANEDPAPAAEDRLEGQDDGDGSLMPAPLAEEGPEPAADDKPEEGADESKNGQDDKPEEGEEGDGGVKPEDEPPKPAPTPGELEIEHTGDPADIPVPSGDGGGADIDHDAGSQPGEPAEKPAEAADSTDNAGGLISAMPQPLAPPAEPAAEAGDDKNDNNEAATEPAADDKPAGEPLLGHHTVIQPLHGQEELGGEPPKPDLDETKFALTPPSMGGTLTASSEPDQPGMPGAAAGHDHPQILKHDAMPQTPVAPVFDASAAEAEPAVAPLPSPVAVTDTPVVEPASAVEPPPALIAAPLLGGNAPAPAAAADDGNGQTLSEIEQSVNSVHLEGAAPAADDPVLKPADMPPPLSANLIPGLQAPPTAPAASGPLAPPPPTPPPIQ